MPYKATEAMTWAGDWATAGTMNVPGLSELDLQARGQERHAMTVELVRGRDRIIACSISVCT